MYSLMNGGGVKAERWLQAFPGQRSLMKRWSGTVLLWRLFASRFSLEFFTSFLIEHVVLMIYSMSAADKSSVKVCCR